MKRWVSVIVLLTLLAVAIFSLGKIADYCYHSNESKNNIRELISDEDTKGENYRRLKEHNPDIVGWIRIPGTPVDYPVMWTEKYLRTDFDGNYSLSGFLFVSADCNVSPMTDAEQDRLYEEYWLKAETLVGYKKLTSFFLDYLNIKVDGFPKESEAYGL